MVGTGIQLNLVVRDRHATRRLCSAAALAVGMALAAVALVPTAALAYVQSTPATGVTTVSVGSGPVNLTHTPNDSDELVLNQNDQSMSIVARANDQVTRTISLQDEPLFVSVSPDGTTAYVIGEYPSLVSTISLATGIVTATTSLDTIPTAEQLSPSGADLFMLDESGEIDDFNTSAKTATTTLAGEPTLGSSYGGVFSPDGSTAYLTFTGNGQGAAGTLEVVTTSTGAIEHSFPLASGAGRLAVSPDGSTAYVEEGQSNSDVAIINTSTGAVTATVSAPGPIQVMTMSPDGSRLAVGTQWDTIGMLSTATQTFAPAVSVDQAIKQIAFSADSSTAFELSGGQGAYRGSVSELNGATGVIEGTVGLGNGPIAMDASSTSHLFAVNDTDGTMADVNLALMGWRPNVTRVYGDDRYATAVAISQQRTPSGNAMYLYVASGAEFPDALGASAIAGGNGASLLLTAPGELPAEVLAEAKRLDPQFIDVIGGPSAVSDAVLAQLQTLDPNAKRLAGNDRFLTNQAVVGARFTPGSAPNAVFIASGLNFPDALSASAAAAANSDPLVLVDGSESSLDQSTSNFLTALGSTQFNVVGGPQAVSAGVVASLQKLGTVTPYAGADRYQTSDLVNQEFFPHATNVSFASGAAFPDALTGSVYAGGHQTPLYLVQPTCVPSADASQFAASGVSGVELFGGPSALSPSVAMLTRCSS